MGPQTHLLASAVLASFVYSKTKDIKCYLLTVAAGTLADTDHLIEYKDYCRQNAQKWDWNEFVSGKYFDKKGTVKVIFHSWEAALTGLALVGTTACSQTKVPKELKNCVKAVTTGYVLHMIMDQVGNNINYKGYFWLYRKRNNWKQCVLL